MLKEFRDFVLRGNVLELAVAVIIAGAFGAIITSLVKDVIMPPIGLLLGGVDFTDLYIVLKEGTTSGPYKTLADARAAGATTLNYGVFINTVIAFLIVAAVIFLLIRAVNRAKRKQEVAAPPPTTKECPFCRSAVAIQATRCAFCTSDLATTPPAVSRN